MVPASISAIGCLPVSFYAQFASGAWSIPLWAQKAKALGLDYIDISAMFFEGRSLDSLCEMRKTLALPVMMVSAYSDFTHPSPEERAQALKQSLICLEASAAIGARYVRLTAGQHHPGQKDDAAIQNAFDGLERCTRRAQQLGLEVLIENHSQPGAWQYPDFNFHTGRFLALWQAIKVLPLSINFDTANAFALGSWQTLLNALAGRIATLHLNDLASLSPLKFCCLGEGVVELEAMLHAILATGFTGPASIEEAGFEGGAGLARAVENARRLCHAVAGTPLH